ncbi:unnamed protein product [Parajaminaea phylloscopi]
MEEEVRLIAGLLTDVHAHPTDDPRLSAADHNGLQQLVDKLASMPLGRVCAMSSCTEDQGLVKDLAALYRERSTQSSAQHVPDLRPCFGYHPWFSHTISLESVPPPKREHYNAVFASSLKDARAQDELEALLPSLPEPRPLARVVEEVRSHLQQFPQALLGEIGLDRAFRIPCPKVPAQEKAPVHPSPTSGDDAGTEANTSNGHTLALRGKKLTNLAVPIEHQSKVMLAQVGVAVELGRNVSFHSVRAGDATIGFLRECCRVYNGTSQSQGAFRDINLDLHSCTLSAEMIQGILRTHPNVYVSFSTAINLRQKNLASQLAMVPPTRLLIESDWHSAEDLTDRNLDMLRLAVPYLSRKSPKTADADNEPGASEPSQVDHGALHEAAKVVASNWQRFDCNSRQIELRGGDTDEDHCESQEGVWRFEDQWWKELKKRGV